MTAGVRPSSTRPVLRSAVLGAALLACLPLAAQQSTTHRLTMSDVDMPVFIGDIAEITGYTFVLPPQIRGQVSVFSSQPLTTAEVFEVFMATLRAHGYAAIGAAPGLYRIAPLGEAGRSGQNSGYRTVVLRLRHADAEEVARLLAPLTGQSGSVTAIRGSKILVINDEATNVGRVENTARQIDQDHSETISIALAHTDASQMVKMVNSLGSGRRDATTRLDVAAAAVRGSNTLVLYGSADDVRTVAGIVAQADSDNRRRPASIRAVALEHASATQIAPVLQNVAQSMSGNGARVTISPYEPTNTVIIAADPAVVQQLEDVIATLDVRQAQVLVEAIIVELSDSKARELGVQLALYGAAGSGVPLVATNFTGSPASLLALSGAIIPDTGSSTPGPILNQAALSELSGANSLIGLFGGPNADGSFLSALVTAIQSDTESRILSTPSILTLDNQQAHILVGQEIPIITGERLSQSNDNPFRTVSRADVGVQLNVTPQVNDGTTIRLEVSQVVSSVAGPVAPGSSDLLTDKREITTTILADDGEVIVLGGLIQNQETVRESKVPLLGDIPVLGHLFRSRSTQRGRTNLMVFLRPVIVRDRASARRQTERKFGASGIDDSGGGLDDFISRALEVDR